LQVLASYGHVRDLLNKAGSVKPEADFELVRSEFTFGVALRLLPHAVVDHWDHSFAQQIRPVRENLSMRNAGRLGAFSSHVEALFRAKKHRCESMCELCQVWSTDAFAAKRGLAEIRAAVKAQRPRRLVLATDPDREGEAISWHVLQELQVCFIIG